MMRAQTRSAVLLCAIEPLITSRSVVIHTSSRNARECIQFYETINHCMEQWLAHLAGHMNSDKKRDKVAKDPATGSTRMYLDRKVVQIVPKRKQGARASPELIILAAQFHHDSIRHPHTNV